MISPSLYHNIVLSIISYTYIYIYIHTHTITYIHNIIIWLGRRVLLLLHGWLALARLSVSQLLCAFPALGTVGFKRNCLEKTWKKHGSPWSSMIIIRYCILDRRIGRNWSPSCWVPWDCEVAQIRVAPSRYWIIHGDSLRYIAIN